MENVVNLSFCRSRSAKISVCVAPSRDATILNFEKRHRVVKSNELVMLERCLAHIQKGYKDQDARAIWEWRDELEVIALYTEDTDIRERCRVALIDNKQASN